MQPVRQHVLIPFHDDGTVERRRNLELVESYWREAFPDWLLHIVRSTDGRHPFNKARLLNRAASLSPARCLVFADADSLAPPEQVGEMVERALMQPRLVYGYTTYLCLSEQTTARLTGWREALEAPAQEEHHLMGSTGCVAIQHRLYRQMGGMDESYEGWGYEDLEFGLRAQLVLGPVERVAGDLTHLWHPRPRPNRANERLYQRQHRQMIEEARSRMRRPAA